MDASDGEGLSEEEDEEESGEESGDESGEEWDEYSDIDAGLGKRKRDELEAEKGKLKELEEMLAVTHQKS